MAVLFQGDKHCKSFVEGGGFAPRIVLHVIKVASLEQGRYRGLSLAPNGPDFLF